MLDEILAHINNYFVVDIKSGGYEISDGVLLLPNVSNGQYIRIVGSIFNDGVYQYPVSNLTDETFVGEVWALAVPPQLVALSSQIEQWKTSNVPTAYASESFGGYSYSKTTNAAGASSGWSDVFRTDLNRWRKL
jgi:hypothetical protein